jgi:hypothetical protein
VIAIKTKREAPTPEEALQRLVEQKAAKGMPATLEQTQRLTRSVLGEVRR